MDLDTKRFGVVVILILAIMQIIAWLNGYDGQVFTFTSMLISAIAAAIFGFTIGIKKGGNETS